MKVIVLFLVLVLSFNLKAEEASPPLPNNIYSPEEIYLLQQLSQRHLALLEKQAQLEEKEKILNQKEVLLNEQLLKIQKETDIQTNQKAKLYMQMPISKALALLNELPEKDVSQILSQMPSNIASRYLSKMETMRAKNILKNMAGSDI